MEEKEKELEKEIKKIEFINENERTNKEKGNLKLLKAELKGISLGRKIEREEIRKKLKTKNIDDSGLDVEAEKYWINEQELLKVLGEK